MRLPKTQVKYVAELARLALSTEELERFSKDLAAIVGYMDILSEVRTQSVAPLTISTGLKNVSRGDKIRSELCLSKEGVLRNAPIKDGDYIKTKAIR